MGNFKSSALAMGRSWIRQKCRQIQWEDLVQSRTLWLMTQDMIALSTWKNCMMSGDV